MLKENSEILTKWAPVLEGINDDYTKSVTAQLLENQAKSILAEKSDRVDEADAPTTVGKLGTFQKFAFPLIRRVYPQLIANSIVGVQPMGGPVSQIFYLGADRVHGATSNVDTIYSKYNLTYRGQTASAIFGDSNGDPAANIGEVATNSEVAFSSMLADGSGGPLDTMGGQIAAWPNPDTILGYSVSAGEALSGDEIAEMNLHIEQQPVVARTRKMRALWTLEAAQDLRAYHGLNLESELTGLLSKELSLEIDRELIEDLRMIAYDPQGLTGWNRNSLDLGNSNDMPNTGDLHNPTGGTGVEGFTPGSYLYDFANNNAGDTSGTNSNVYLVDLSGSFINSQFAAQHVGHVYANLLAVINFASNDIYRTTHRGPGTWLITSPIVASMLESAAKLEGGVAQGDRPTNNAGTSVEYRGKFAGKYDLYIDPMYPDDEIMIGYKGTGPMDAGYVYSPYIPLQQLPTITDPQTFQPRKGILTRYGKAAVAPASRFYRIIRLVGATASFLFPPFQKASNLNTGAASANQGKNIVG
jgi:hypothetical protein